MAIGKKVFVFSDPKYETEEIVEYLDEHNFEPLRILDRKKQKEILTSPELAVVLLNFGTVDGARSFLSETKDLPKKAKHLILLTPLSDSDHAARMIENRLINDYCVFKPLYDVNRLRASISRAIVDLENANRSIVEETKQHASQMIEGAIESGDEINAIIAESNKQLTKRLENILGRFEDRMLHAEMENVVKVVDSDALKDHFDHMRSDELATEAKSVTIGFAKKVEDWVSSVKEKCGISPKQIKNKKKKDGAKTVLLVDDQPTSLKILRIMLKPHNYDVVIASNAKEAVTKATQHQPDVILMDIMMPDISGIELTKIFKEDPDLQHFPIFMLSGHAFKENVEKSLEYGAVDFIAKPVRLRLLLEKFDLLFKGDQKEDQEE